MHLLSRTECNARWLLHLINNNFLNFLTETILNPYLIEFSYPKIPKMCDPILVTLLKMQPHSSQSSRENATPSSGTSPLASYKGVPPARVIIEKSRLYFLVCSFITGLSSEWKLTINILAERQKGLTFVCAFFHVCQHSLDSGILCSCWLDVKYCIFFS